MQDGTTWNKTLQKECGKAKLLLAVPQLLSWSLQHTCFDLIGLMSLGWMWLHDQSGSSYELLKNGITAEKRLLANWLQAGSREVLI